MSSYQDYANAASDLILRRGEVQARGIANKGQILGNTIATLGDRIPKQIQEVMRVQAEKRRQAEIQGIFQKYGMDLDKAIPEVMQIDPALGSRLQKDYADAQQSAFELKKAKWDFDTKRQQWALNLVATSKDPDTYARNYLAAQMADPDLVKGWPTTFDPAFVEQAGRSLMTEIERRKADEPKPPPQSEPLERVVENGKPVLRPRSQAAGMEPFVQSPTPAADPLVEVVENGRPVLRPRSQSSGATPYHVPPASASADGHMWVSRNGQLIRIKESEYQQGDLPANTREQGRPVTSGDANRIAEVNQSIAQAKDLESLVGKTGPGSYVGTKVPDAVTALTGWGADSKSRLATIALVKQIIGKGLEEGVLRAEDERKYEKILPTISDATPVVKSKIAQLQQMLLNKREERLSALEDAGYDTSRFRARAEAAPTNTAPTAKPAPKVGDTVTYNGKRYKVKAIKNGQAEVEAIP